MARPTLVIVGYTERLAADHEVLTAAARAAGYETELVDPSRLAIDATHPATVTLDGTPFTPAVALPRGVNRPWPMISAVFEIWAAAGTVVVPGVAAATVAADKLATARVLAAVGVPVLPTIGVVPGAGVAITGADALATRPVVVKPARGSKARGVEIHDDLASALDSLRRGRALVDDQVDHQVVQPLATGAGVDHRVIVAAVDDTWRTIAITRRAAPAGTLITNVGGTVTDVDPADAPEIAAVAEAAARVLGLEFAGIDVIDHHGQPVVLEANAWPGLAPEARGTGLADALMAVVDRRRATSS